MNRILCTALIIYCSVFSLTARSENIVFDLFGVLVTIPAREKIRHFIGNDSLKYLFHERKDITKFHATLFTMLSQVPCERASSAQEKDITAEGLPMPKIMIAWQAGEITSLDALKSVDEYLTSADYTEVEKNLFRKGSRLAFDLKTRKERYRFMKDGVDLVKRLHAEKTEAGAPRHRLYILSNMDQEMMIHLAEIAPELFAMFEGVVFSAEAKALKPQQEIYETLFARYELEAKDCILIDDQRENIEAAKALGMNGILCDSHAHVRNQLEQQGLVKPKRFVAAALASLFVGTRCLQ